MFTSNDGAADPTGVMGLRIAAFAIDLGVIFVISVAVMLAAFFTMAQRSPASQVTCNSGGLNLSASINANTDAEGRLKPQFCVQDGNDVLYIPAADEGTFSSTFYLSGFLVGVADLVVLQGLTGSSLGKLLVGLKVIRGDGGPVGVARALVRYLFLAIDAGCCFVIGAATSFTSAGHRRVGDMVAQTLVVSKRWVPTPPNPSPPPMVPGAAPSPFGTPGAQGPPTMPAQPPTIGQAPPVQWPQPGEAARPSDDPSSGGDGPFWDAARDTYILYDRSAGAWVEWDEAARAWVPISR